MSEVAVSPAAGLRRLAGLPRAGSGVCRSLFGPVDHGDLRQELQGRLRELAEEARERWGFDFQAGKPVPGSRLPWEPLCATAVPAFYREKQPRSGLDPALACAEGNASKINAGQGLVCPEAAAAEQVSQENQPQAGQGRGTARITDFFPKRKRAAPPSGACEFLPSGCTIPGELTPKKRLR